MANSFNGIYWHLDTVVSTTSVTTDPVVVSKIRWVSANTVGAQARISDSNGQPANGFWTAIGSGQAYTEESNFLQDMTRSKRTLNGLRVMSLTSGFIQLYVE